MWKLLRASAILAVVMVACVTRTGTALADRARDPKQDQKSHIKPDVAAILRQSTDTYAKMSSYRHTARWSITGKTADGEVREELSFTLALDRPNRFVYKLDSKSKIFPPVAAYSDGDSFINFKTIAGLIPIKQYTKAASPATYKGINIVDDIEFLPIGTYVIALMLQGDVLSDKDIRAAMEKATQKPAVTENGKKWQVVEMLFGPREEPIQLYFGSDDHLIGKAVQKGDVRITEIVDAVKIDKPIDAATFQYALPADAKQVERFSAPQRPDDAHRAVSPSRIAGR